MNGKIMTQKEYIEKCKRFNPEYDYSEVNFVKLSGTFVTPICLKHGKFTVNSKGLCSKHMKCPECDRENRFNEFVQKARKIHGDKYKYDLNTYKTNKSPLRITCPSHGDFMQAPGDHLKGYGCSKCSGKYKPSTEEWIKNVSKLYNGKFDYSKVIYKDNKTNVIVGCPVHGDFLVTPNNHIKGNGGCPKCAAEHRHNIFKKSTDQFIIDSKKVHGNKYNYSKVDYYNKATNVIIICPIHGEFQQTPNVHLEGHGCPACSYKNQGILQNKLQLEFPDIKFISEFKDRWLGLQRLDIFCKEYNFAVEYDGEQHFHAYDYFGGESYFKTIQERDLSKNKKCIENNCKLFRVKFGYSEKDFEELVSNIKLFIKDRNFFIPKLRKGSKITII